MSAAGQEETSEAGAKTCDVSGFFIGVVLRDFEMPSFKSKGIFIGGRSTFV